MELADAGMNPRLGGVKEDVVRYVCTAILLAMVALMPLLSGCVPTALMASRALEERAEDSRLFPAGIARVWPATLAALRQLQVQVTNTAQDNLGGDIDGVWPGGDAVVIRVDQSGEGQTRVKVRVGGVRDRDATGRIFAGIGNNL
jgi:uncharacterized protein DUF3568